VSAPVPRRGDPRLDDPALLLRLCDVEAIKRLKARYFRTMDTKRWDEFARVFSPDAEIDVSDDAGPEAGRVQGREQIARFIEAAVGDARTVHHGHMPEIEITGPDTASGVWAMFDYVEFPSEEGRLGLRGYGHYHEQYQKAEGAWRIRAMRLARLRVDPLTDPE